MRYVRRIVLTTLFSMAIAPLIVACGTDASDSANSSDGGIAAEEAGGVPAEHQVGAENFVTHCSECHGVDANGTDQGPPLIHIYYEPNHHPDESFLMAAQVGVRQHHWAFGDMPPVEAVTEADMQPIIDYVRSLQRDAGIY